MTLAEKLSALTWGGSPLYGEYDGECKGEGHAQDQLKLQNQLVQQQLDQQKSIRDQIMGSVGKYLTGSGEGFDPQQLAIMQAQFLDQNAAAGKQAGQNVMAQLAARGAAGGNLPASGDFARSLEGLQGAIATSQSQGILGTNLANLQQALTNRFNAASVAGGQAAQLGNNVGTFNSGASNALNQYMQAANSGFGASFMRGLGGGLGGAIAGIATGGIGSALGGLSKILGGLGKAGPGSFPTPDYSTISMGR